MRAAVCGSRDLDDYNLFCKIMNHCPVVHEITEVVHGGQRGADTLAGQWSKGVLRKKPIVQRADWKKYGKGAGPVRNSKIIKFHSPDVCIAIMKQGSANIGTMDMVEKCARKNIDTYVYMADGNDFSDISYLSQVFKPLF